MLKENTRGDRFPHHAENVPEELKAEERWVTCDESKVPLVAIPSGAVYAAKSTDPSTWRSYETAFETWQENEHIAGVGRTIGGDEDYVGIDLDDVLTLTRTGEVDLDDEVTHDLDDEVTHTGVRDLLTPWAARIVERLDSYAEISPSLTGVKIWVRAPEITRAYKKPGLEIYPRGRYFTVTGLVLGEPRPIRDVGDELTTIIEEEFPRVNRVRSDSYDGPERTLNLNDLLDRARLEVFEESLTERSAERTYHIRCPWYEEHSHGDISGTRVGQYENGALFFKCEHAHCAHRLWREFRHYLEALIHLGRPPRVAGGRLR